MKPYNPFKDINRDKLCSEIRIRNTVSNKVALNEFILHKSIGKGSYAQVRAGYDLVSEQPVAMRFVNRKNLSKKIGLEKGDAMVANSTRIHLMLTKSLQLFQLIYAPKFFQSFDDKILIPVSHQIYENFTSDFTLSGNINKIEQDETLPSLRSYTPRFSNEFVYDNCTIQVLELANRGNMHNLQASESQFQNLLLQVAEQLQEMHEKHIVHCDLKSENVMLLDKNDVLSAKLSDFDTSVILTESKLKIIQLHHIYLEKDIENLNFIIIDSYNTDFIGEIITTPAISAPETRQFANVFMATETDLWQFGQLLLSQICGVTKNITISRNSKEFEIIEYNFSYDLADLIAGLTEVNPALRYDMDMVVQHSYFSSGLTDIGQFHLNLSNSKAKRVIQGSKEILKYGECVQYANETQILTFIQFIEHIIIMDIKPLFEGEKEQFSLRQNQNEKVTDLVFILSTTLSQFKKQISPIKRSQSATSPHKLLNYQSKFYKLDYIYQFLTPDVLSFINSNKLLFKQLTSISCIDIRDFQHKPKKQIFKACQGLQYLNIIIRLSQFNLYRCYYQSDHTYIPQTQYSTFELDVERRKAQLVRSIQDPINLPKLNVQQSIHNIQNIMRDVSTDEQGSQIKSAAFEVSSEDLEDLPCKFTPAVTQPYQNTMPKFNISLNIPNLQISLPKLNFAEHQQELSQVDNSKITFEHRLPEVINPTVVQFEHQQADEIEAVDPDQYFTSTSDSSSLSQEFLHNDNDDQSLLLSKICNQSLRRSQNSRTFEPVDWALIRKQQDTLQIINEEKGDSETNRSATATLLSSKEDSQNLDELQKLSMLFTVTKVDEIVDYEVEGNLYDIGDCSSGSI